MAGGAPRTVSFPPDQMIQLGEEMLEWVEKNKPIHIKQWYSIVKMFTYNQWKTFISCEEFFPYYEKAISIISIRYINGDINPSISQRFLKLYFKDVRDQEDHDLDAAMERSKKVEGVKNDKYIVIANAALTAGSNVSTEAISGEISSSS